MKTLIDEDTTQNGMPTTLEDLSSKSQGSEEGEGRKGGERRSVTEQMLKVETIVALT